MNLVLTLNDVKFYFAPEIDHERLHLHVDHVPPGGNHTVRRFDHSNHVNPLVRHVKRCIASLQTESSVLTFGAIHPSLKI